MRILGNIYTVEIVPRDDARLQGSWAKSSIAGQWILLAKDQGRAQLQSSMLHELIEVASVMGSLDLPEAKVRVLEAMLYAMLTDNGVDLSPLVGGV